jgi:hypothetical protein
LVAARIIFPHWIISPKTRLHLAVDAFKLAISLSNFARIGFDEFNSKECGFSVVTHFHFVAIATGVPKPNKPDSALLETERIRPHRNKFLEYFQLDAGRGRYKGRREKMRNHRNDAEYFKKAKAKTVQPGLTRF